MEDSDEDYPTPGIEFNISTATNNETNIDTSSDVDNICIYFYTADSLIEY
jgi:hypothetical protein